MKNLEQLQEYYDHQLKDLYNISFDQLSNHQLKRLTNSLSFKIWKIINRRPSMLNVIKKAPDIKNLN